MRNSFCKEIIKLLSIIAEVDRFEEDEYLYLKHPYMFGQLNEDKINDINFNIKDGNLYIEYEDNINYKDIDLSVNENGCLIQNIY